MNLEVARKELSRVRVDRSEAPALGVGQVRLRIEGFALSTNNITYAVYGDVLRYWEFFPPTPGSRDEWGRIPVWGFAEVVETRSPDTESGERLFGYYPMSSELVIDAGRADERGVSDVAPHRAEMAGAYSRYVRCATDPVYRADREDHQMLLYPLFFTAFVIDDFLVDNESFRSGQIVVSSASSKTAIGVAHLARRRGARVVGLTSPGNRAFVEDIDVFDEVHTYDDIEQVDVTPSVYIDITGDRDVLYAVHRRLDGVLGHSMTGGGTHWAHHAAVAAVDVPPPAPVFFFAPSQIAKRTREWGRGELDRRMGSACDHFDVWVDGWIDFRHAQGPDGVTDVYHQLLAGHPDPRAGYICSLVDRSPA